MNEDELKKKNKISIGQQLSNRAEFDNLESFEEKADYLMNDSINKSSFDKIDLQMS